MKYLYCKIRQYGTSVNFDESHRYGLKCGGCDSTIQPPDPVWYAGTKDSIKYGFYERLCDTCVQLIPVESRIATSSLKKYALTLGKLKLQKDEDGNWANESDFGEPEFCMDERDLESSMPNYFLFADSIKPFIYTREWVEYFFTEYNKNSQTDAAKARESLIYAIARKGLSIACMLDMETSITPRERIDAIFSQLSKEDGEKLLVELEKRGWK